MTAPVRPARLHRLRRSAGWLWLRWQSSLTIRVATTTLLLSGTAAVLVGLTILHQVEDGLQRAAQRTAVSQLDNGLHSAGEQFDAAPHGDRRAIEQTAFDTVQQLAARGSQQESYGVYLLPKTTGSRSDYAPSDYPLPADAVPAAVRGVVNRQNRVAWQPTLLRRPGLRAEPALAVGAPVPTAAADYNLFYVFPLAQQAQTLALVQRTILVSGAVLVLLLAGVAVVVTRQVVRPVRAAATIAERLASGRHRERMPVRGRDELASLGTSFNRMAEQVQQQITQLRELSRVQQRFVADVSHELRTPITTVRMAADVLHEARDDLPPDLARAAELLQTQLDRFEALLGDLLEISRHDAGVAVLDAEPVDLTGILRRVLDAAEPLAERRGCRLRLVAPSSPVIAEVDARRVDRILRNLVSNAIEHGAGRPVELRLGTGPDSIAVTVRDLGTGLLPGQASLVFGRFWRADPARTRATGGTGLGLSIALEDARLHGGWLQAWGEPGRGSVFRLTLPWHAGEVVHHSPLPLDPGQADDVPAIEATGDDAVPAAATSVASTPAVGADG
jgi:two-component system sensor histidine kinase MtrB